MWSVAYIQWHCMTRGDKRIFDEKSSNRKYVHARLEIISDVVSEKARTGKIPIPHRFFSIPHRYFRCGIGIFPLRAFSDTTSEIISNRVENWDIYYWIYPLVPHFSLFWLRRYWLKVSSFSATIIGPKWPTSSSFPL